MKWRPSTDALLALGPAVLALVLVLSRIDPGGSYATLEGPGLTFDESFNVEHGVYAASACREYGLTLFTPRGAAEVFDVPEYLPDHPPLGRLALGTVHELVMRVYPPRRSTGRFNVAAARVGSALAFAATVFLVALATIRWQGRTAGVCAGFALVLMPRALGHAHLASLETMIGLAWTAAVFSAARLADAERPVKGAALIAGGLFGLALLTKIQAVLLPLAILPWWIWVRRERGILAGGLWLASGGLVFLCLWPWLWLDPIAHISEYLGRTTDRLSLNTWYFGAKYPDHETPWHYPAVMFLFTVPAGLHALGCVGAVAAVRARLKDERGLLVACTVMPLVVFAIPGIAVYDGVRLFLVIYPLWAVLIGSGCATALDWLKTRTSHRRAAVALVTILVAQSVGTLKSGPFFLSYYNALCGGVNGAAGLGLEATYWGDAVVRSVWDQVPEGSTVYVAPVLHPTQLACVQSYVPRLAERDIKLEAFRYDPEKQRGWLLLIHRHADPPPPRARPVTTLPPKATVRLGRVRLTSLIDTRLRAHRDGAGQKKKQQ